jgi:hypothetical protein
MTSAKGANKTATVLRGVLRSTHGPSAGGAVGQALGLRGPRRPAITCFDLRLQRSTNGPGGHRR